MRRSSLAIAAGLLALAGCAVPPPEAYVASGGARAAVQSRPIGNNERGEACLAQTAPSPNLDLPVARAEEAFCGGWTQPSARIFTLRGQGSLDAIATSGLWRSWLDQRVQCQAPQATTIAGGLPAWLIACTRRSNGSAHMALAVSGPDGLVLADGLPASLPAIERMITGQQAQAGPVVRSEALQLAVSRLAADRVGAADEAQYERLMLLGRELNQTENFAGAEDVYRQALAARVAVLRSDSDPSLATPIMHIALNLSNQGRYQEADRLFARAGDLAKDAADRTAPARLEQYRGMHELNRDMLPAASERFVLAEAEYRKLVPASLLRAAATGQMTVSEVMDPQAHSAVLGLAETIRYRGVVASRRGDTAQAAADQEASRTVLRNAGLAPGILEGRKLRSEGMALVRSDRNEAAAQRLTEAGNRLAMSLPGERPVATTLFLAGRQWMLAGRTTEAVAAFRSGAQVLRERRIGLSAEDVIPYIDALQAAARRNPAEADALNAEAFAAAQLTRRSETARFLTQTSARLGASGGNEQVAGAIRRRQDLDVELRALLIERDAVLAAERGAGDLDARIREKRAAREEAESDIAAAAPEYLQLRDGIIEAQQAAERLSQREALVQIVLGVDHSYALGSRRGQPARIARLDITERDSARLVRAARTSVDAGPRADGSLLPFNTAPAAELYDRLLRPLEAMLEGADTLVIVPDGPLLGLPFGMLLTGPADAGNLATAPWLIRRFAVVHAPSVQALMTLRGRSQSSEASRPYLGFGDFLPASPPQLARSFPAGRCGNDAAAAASLTSLPGFRIEVQLAASVMGAGSVQRLGADFTAEAVAQTRLRDFRIVHFATHGLLPGDLSCLIEPAIMVSNPRNAPDATGSFLTASAITRLQMDADLVILSACNTAGSGVEGGSEQSAEALSGLARSFFIAGARGLLATHWLADDVAATVLMTRMLRIQTGAEESDGRAISSALALQRAQVGLMAASSGSLSYAHPFYWAAFALIGDGRRSPPAQTASTL
ncbi:MAG: hypothetical protein JWR10_1231 [Rubritepida sp.]|nr:hypothetical protein [Rubritepida sp.]